MAKTTSLGVMVMVAKNEEVDNSLFGFELEEYDSLAKANKRKKSARAKRRKDKKTAKAKLRQMAVDNPEEFFSKSKRELRDKFHLSPYSLKRLRFNHCDKMVGSRAKVEKKAKEAKKEIKFIKKEYLGMCSKEITESLVPTHIETLIDELAEVTDITPEVIIGDNSLLLFLTNIYKPEKYLMVCEYVENVA